MPERFLSVENVAVAYGHGRARSQALRDVSLSFSPASLTLVMGPSGSGKTTLLSLLGCLLTPHSGSVYVGGREVNGLSDAERTRVRQTHIGFVFQAFRLFRALSAVDNVTISNEIAGTKAGRQAAEALLDELGLGDKLRLKPDALSGGEKQRVAIARALLRRPPILLADEPTASLDSQAGRQIIELLRRLAERRSQAIIVVSHDARWEEYAGRIVVLRDGAVIEDRNPRT